MLQCEHRQKKTQGKDRFFSMMSLCSCCYVRMFRLKTSLHNILLMPLCHDVLVWPARLNKWSDIFPMLFAYRLCASPCFRSSIPFIIKKHTCTKLERKKLHELSKVEKYALRAKKKRQFRSGILNARILDHKLLIAGSCSRMAWCGLFQSRNRLSKQNGDSTTC